MNGLVRLATMVYRRLIACYPAEFRAEFGPEMQTVFAANIRETGRDGWPRLLALFGREIRDLPGAVWREYLSAKKGYVMNQNKLAWRPLTTTELLAGLALFVLPILYAISDFVFGYHSPTNLIRSILFFAPAAFTLIVLILGLIKGLPRWTISYVGAILTGFVFVGPFWQLWSLIVPSVYRVLGGRPTALPKRVIYQALMSGFAWFLIFAVAVLLILLLMVWPRTRQLARRIRADWTLLSFLLYGGVVFAILFVFDEYLNDEPWMIAAWACLAAGAWAYLKGSTPRKRILALLGGVTLAYWIAAVGKWYLVPLQTWGAFHGYDYETYRWFEFWRTLAEWGWVMLFMLTPALLTLIPRSQESDPAPGENLAPA